MTTEALERAARELFPPLSDYEKEPIEYNRCQEKRRKAWLMAKRGDAAEIEKLREALILVRKIITDGAMVGFNSLDGDWAERLFKSQGQTFDVLYKLSEGGK